MYRCSRQPLGFRFEYLSESERLFNRPFFRIDIPLTLVPRYSSCTFSITRAAFKSSLPRWQLSSFLRALSACVSCCSDVYDYRVFKSVRTTTTSVDSAPATRIRIWTPRENRTSFWACWHSRSPLRRIVSLILKMRRLRGTTQHKRYISLIVRFKWTSVATLTGHVMSVTHSVLLSSQASTPTFVHSIS